MKKLACIFACAMALSACTNTQAPLGKSLQDLDGEWSVVSVKGQDFTAAEQIKKAFIGIKAQDKRLYGSASCNRIMSEISYDDKDGLNLGKVASTMMLCPDMDNERLLLEALSEVKDYQISGDKLYLLNKDNQPLVELSRIAE